MFELDIADIPKIESSANYWLFRTRSGYLYEPFIKQNIIAIGYQAVTLEKINTAFKSKQINPIQTLKKIVKDCIPNCREGLIASQLNRFLFEMKMGDYILIPNNSSETFFVGIIDSENTKEVVLTKKDKELDGLYKSRSVKWIREIRKWDTNPNLFRLFNSHQLITNANEYANWIDSLLHDFYIKNNLCHISLNVKTTDGLNANDLFKTFIGLIDIVESFITITDYKSEFDNEIEVKLNLNSPGFVNLISKSTMTLFVLGVISHALIGGEFKIQSDKLGLNVEIQSTPLLSQISSFLNDSKNREILSTLNSKVDKLKIAKIADINKLLVDINKSNKKE